MTLEHMTQDYSLYFHIPFCTHRCAYCDFNTYAGHESLIPAYVDALCAEIRFVAASAPERLPVHTIFFGGGTPSLLTPLQFNQIFQTIRASFTLTPSYTSDSSNSSGASGSSPLETSLEANPGTVTLDSLQGLRQTGFDRISFGVQSFHPVELRQLERIHAVFDVLDAVRWARKAGFENLNLDLIYGLPEQTPTRWQESLRRAVDLAPQHLSLYALTIEHGTPFGRWAARGLLPVPDPDLAADMYDAASDYLAGQGYQQYEISNWSKPGFQCQHNLTYWRNQPYLGFGAGAHGCVNGLRISNVLRIKTYLEHLSPDSPTPSSPHPLTFDPPISPHGLSSFEFPISPATVTRTALTPYVEMQETLMLGLRLTQEGVSAQAFQVRFGRDLLAVFGTEIDELVGLGLLELAISPAPSGERAGVRVRLTPRGRLLGNQVFMRFVG
jgi:oxygen-independent coproporphyrinogen-3 oxidase